MNIDELLGKYKKRVSIDEEGVYLTRSDISKIFDYLETNEIFIYLGEDGCEIIITQAEHEEYKGEKED